MVVADGDGWLFLYQNRMMSLGLMLFELARAAVRQRTAG